MAEIYPYIQAALDKRRADVPPNYFYQHTCVVCKRTYHCPDRFTELRCVPTAFCEERGWSGNWFSCLPCTAGWVDNANATAWWEAHGVEDSPCEL